jgi:hypothetical protein
MNPSDSIHARFLEPFDKSEEKQRQGPGGKMLTYIDARAVMRRLDEVVGTAGWQTKMVAIGSEVACELSIKFGDEWITKTDGAGETSMEGEKGQFSDAFKRAAVHFGIGRYLYAGDTKVKREKAPPLKDQIGAHAEGEAYPMFDEAEMQMKRLLTALDDGQTDIEAAKLEKQEILMEFSPQEKTEFWFSRFTSGQRTIIKRLGLDP